MNKNVPNRSQQEYCEATKAVQKEYKKEYYEANKATIKENNKEYYEANKATIKENHKEYRETNKEKIISKQNEKFDCECGGKYTYANKSRHFKTNNKHKKYIQSLVNQNNII